MSTVPKRAVVIAHYDPAGLLRTDLYTFIKQLKNQSEVIILVSTKLTPEWAQKLGPLSQVIVRANTGYDFYSYKIGIEALGDLKKYDELLIFNSSFLILDPEKLLKKFIDFPRLPKQLFGITKSQEHGEHVQSYFVAFPREALHSEHFQAWWQSVESIDKREDVIRLYELGMSDFFKARGFLLEAVFEQTPERYQKALQRFREAYGGVSDVSSASNPTHFNYDELLEEMGIIKIELLAKNPHGLNLSPFYAEYGKKYGSLIKEARRGLTYKDRAKTVRRSLQKLLRRKRA